MIRLYASAVALIISASGAMAQTAQSACGQVFGNQTVTTSNGQILADGQPFIAHGVDVWAQQVIADPNGAAHQILSDFPGVNMVRIAAGDGYSTDTAAALAPFVLLMRSQGVVVEIGDYNPQFTSSVPSGSSLQAETAWVSSLAAAFKGDSGVWFSTANEPSDTAGPGSVAAEQQAFYNAVRATGNTAMVGLENTQWMMGGAPQASASMNSGNTVGMSNVFLDVHYYDWLSGYSTDVANNTAAMQSEVEQARSAYGNIPVIIGEFGNSTTGTGIDAGGTATVTAVTQSGYGWTAWGVNPGGSGDQLTNGDGSLTDFGQQVASAIGSAPRCGATVAALTAALTQTAQCTVPTASQAQTALAALSNSTTDLNTLSQNLTGGAGGAGSTQATPGAASILANAQAALASAQAAICGLPSVSAASTPTVVATTTPAAPQSLGAPAVMQAVNAITPGAGSFTDSAGNTYAIDPGSDNTATIDGQPITPNGESTNTSQMTMVSGVVYGQDATTNQWFEMFPGPGSDRPWAWEPLTNLPTAGESPTPTDRWVTAVSAQ